jgi:hypothetical protein
MKKMMKRFIYSVLASFMLCAFLSACDEDQELCINLAGGWHGDFGAFYVDSITSDTSYSNSSYVIFTPQYPNEKYGSGTQTDYYSGGKSVTSDINWEIIYGRIYLTYRDDPSRDVRLTEYTLNDSAFFGYFPDDRQFDMHKDK